MAETTSDSVDLTDHFDAAKKHIIKFTRPKDVLAWKSIGATIIYEVIAIILISNGLQLLGWALNTLNLVRIFVQFHDMAHFSFFLSTYLNKLIGHIFGVYVHFPFAAWRDGHNHHHKHFGNLDRLDLSQTIMFSKKQYESMKTYQRFLIRIFREPIVFFLFTSPFVWFFGLYYVVAKRYGIFSVQFGQKILSMVFVFVLMPALGVSGFKVFFSTYLVQLIGTILFHLQHSVNIAYRQRKNKWDFTKAALQGSTFLYIPKILQPFTNGIEYHHIHHLNTNIASYNISECHYSFQKSEEGEKPANKWDDYQINRVNLRLAFKSLFNVMLDQEKNILLPFSYKIW